MLLLSLTCGVLYDRSLPPFSRSYWYVQHCTLFILACESRNSDRFCFLCSPIMSKAQIQKPAPPFSGTAINKHGEFVDLKLSDYKGMNFVICSEFRISMTIYPCFTPYLLLLCCRQIFGTVFLSTGLVSDTSRLCSCSTAQVIFRSIFVIGTVT